MSLSVNGLEVVVISINGATDYTQLLSLLRRSPVENSDNGCGLSGYITIKDTYQ